jgi:two-component system chemotaxis sensor kinase CheA
MHQDDEALLNEVVAECLDHAGHMETQLLKLESAAGDPDPEVINSIFRSAHSIKGACGFCGLNSIKNLAHAFENALNILRQGQIKPTPDKLDVLLSATDYLKALLNDFKDSENLDISPYLKMLEHVVSSTPASGVDAAPESRDVSFADSTGKFQFTLSKDRIDARIEQGHNIYILSFPAPSDDLDAQNAGKGLMDVLAEWGEVLETGYLGLHQAVLFATPLLQDTITDMLADYSVTLEQVAGIPSTEDESVQGTAGVDDSQAVDGAPSGSAEKLSTIPAAPNQVDIMRAARTQVQTFLRVNVTLLDQLMNLAGELVLSRNHLLQMVDSIDQPSINQAAQRIDVITSEIQTKIMQTRMQELSGVFGKFPRLVRDLARALGKQVELTMEGQDVELDKAIIEALGDPLVHIIRNSLDHGFEDPEIRRNAGKPATGILRVRAFHEAGQVIIEISDDGAGIDIARIKGKAVKMGLIRPAEAGALDDRSAVNLIFHAGLSTADTVTEVSGRGVGMDVVKANIEKLGGNLEMSSTSGKGTNTRIKLPLTMAIIPCLIIRVGKNERYAVPQINLMELVRVRTSELSEKVSKVGNAEVLRLRGNLLPLVRLADVLNTDGYFRDPGTNYLLPDRRLALADRRQEELNEEEIVPELLQRSGLDRRQSMTAINILVLSAGDLDFGLVVDELEDTEEIVVKPLGRHLMNIPAYAGATIMGDGRVAPILDILGLAQQADLRRKKRAALEASKEETKASEVEITRDQEKILIFEHSPGECFGVPLSLVARIERVNADLLQKHMGKYSVPYGKGALSLVFLDQHLPAGPFPKTKDLFVIIFEVGDREIGLVAVNLLDEQLVLFELDTKSYQHKGIMGSLVVAGKTVIVLDIFELLELEDPNWTMGGKEPSEDEKVLRVLLVEDSEFFLRKVSEYLREAGFDVVTAANGRLGLETLENEDVDIILTDIMMPEMDGYEMVRQIRSEPKWSNLRIIGLSSLAGDEDVQKGLDVGMDRYLIKLDRAGLIETIWELSVA